MWKNPGVLFLSIAVLMMWLPPLGRADLNPGDTITKANMTQAHKIGPTPTHFAGKAGVNQAINNAPTSTYVAAGNS